MYLFNLLIDTGFLPFNVYAFFELDLYGIKVKGMKKRICVAPCKVIQESLGFRAVDSGFHMSVDSGLHTT